MPEHMRDLISGPVTIDYLAAKAAEGWRIAAVEWVRGAEAAAPFQAAEFAAASELPYGLQLSTADCQLEPNPLERTVLLLMLDGIVREKRITEIALELNAGGFQTRRRKAWTASDVFELLPRLIEAGPMLLKSDEWKTVPSRWLRQLG